MTILDWFFICLFLAGAIIIAVLHFRAKKLMARISELEIQILLDKPRLDNSFMDFLGEISNDFDFLVMHVGKGDIGKLPHGYIRVVFARFEKELLSHGYQELKRTLSIIASSDFSSILREYLVSYGLFFRNREHLLASVEAHYSQYVVGRDDITKSTTNSFKKELQKHFSFDHFYEYILEPVFRERFSGIS